MKRSITITHLLFTRHPPMLRGSSTHQASTIHHLLLAIPPLSADSVRSVCLSIECPHRPLSIYQSSLVICLSLNQLLLTSMYPPFTVFRLSSTSHDHASRPPSHHFYTRPHHTHTAYHRIHFPINSPLHPAFIPYQLCVYLVSHLAITLPAFIHCSCIRVHKQQWTCLTSLPPTSVIQSLTHPSSHHSLTHSPIN